MNTSVSKVTEASREWDFAQYEGLFERAIQLSGIPQSNIAAFELKKDCEENLLQFAKAFAECAADASIQGPAAHNPNGARAFLATALRLKSDRERRGAAVFRLYGNNPQSRPKVEALNLPDNRFGELARIVAFGYYELRD